MSIYRNNLTEINSWEQFFSYANTLTEKGKGDVFEYLTKLILTTKSEYISVLKDVWIQHEGIPTEIINKLNLPNTDEGIDIIAETFTGEYWAIQCKYKGRNQTPTYKELSTFGNLANNYCKNISLALLVHTGEKGVRKRKLLGENYTEIGLDFWLGLKSDDWLNIHKKIKGLSSRPIPMLPRPHQENAITCANDHFLQNDAKRGRLIMPCGTGKSLTAFWIANALGAKSIIVTVPSLALIKQSLEDWTREFVANQEEPRPEWLVICSDESTANLDKDEFVSDTYSMGIPTTTNVDVIISFLSKRHGGRKVIFTTYQSSDKLAQASRECDFTFDLAILDEAHKTVGVHTKSFATLLSDKNISISKRIFMTATERVIRGNNDDVYSMDDVTIYGEQFYRLTFKDAIHSVPPIISDYKILTISVTNEEIKQLIAKNKLITDKSNKLEEQESQSLASAIALRKATQKYGIKHAISFHRSIKSADDFSILNTNLNDSNFDSILITSSHISSKKSAGERARLLKDFSTEQLALMTNARCLTEGVDVPAIDCVLFADPKQSAIDIVQAAGRALRPFAGKEFGYIMLPIIVPDNATLEEFTESTPFKEVARIIAALSTQDEGIAEEFRITTNGKSLGGKRILFDGNIPVGLNLDINFFAEKINAKIWERVSKINWRPFEEARAFIHGLKLKNQFEWYKYCKTGNKPDDISSNPHRTYLNNGWRSMGDWLGTGTIASQFIQYLSYSEAKDYVQKLNLKSIKQWLEYCKSGERPENIPANAQKVYYRKGWEDWGEWLGTGTIASQDLKYRPFQEAKSFVINLNIKSVREWRDYVRSGEKPEDIPSKPYRTYGNHGWINWGDWLGTGTIAPYNKMYRPFEEARTFVHELKLNGQVEWKEYCKSGKKPDDITASPHKTYSDKGWVNLGDWLGTSIIAPRLRKYQSFGEAQTYVHTLKLKSKDEWTRYCHSGSKPEDIPTVPHNTYKNAGWINWGDWLGTGTIAAYNKVYRPFEEARAFVHELKLKGSVEWNEYCKSGKKPVDIPGTPNKTYSDKGWINLGDWLGNGIIAPRLRKYQSFGEARTFAHTLNLKSSLEWNKYCHSGKKPDDIPTAPHNTYRNTGWINWGDWLGTGTIAHYNKVYRPFEKAQAFAHNLNLKSNLEWTKYCHSGKKPDDIPTAPQHTYKNTGWTNWGDWLGTGNISSGKRRL